jgi:hypothetical protein
MSKHHHPRNIKKIWESTPTLEGAGVRLKRAFGFHELPLLDPFLLLDDFRSENPEDYKRGFPWHPHRGAAWKPSPMFWTGMLNTVTAWVIKALFQRVMCNG